MFRIPRHVSSRDPVGNFDCVLSCLSQLDVEVVATKRATHFFDSTRLGCKCHLDEDEWVGIIQAENWVVYLFLQVWTAKGDPILHIEVLLTVFSNVHQVGQ